MGSGLAGGITESLSDYPDRRDAKDRPRQRRVLSKPGTHTRPHACGLYPNNAYTEFMEKQIGSLETGKLADLVVLSQDLYKIPAVQIGKTKVLLTMVDGRIVWWSGV